MIEQKVRAAPARPEACPNPTLCCLLCGLQWRTIPIHFAAEGGHLDVVRLLQEAGADLDAKTSVGQIRFFPFSLHFPDPLELTTPSCGYYRTAAGRSSWLPSKATWTWCCFSRRRAQPCIPLLTT